jgi:hypothetical protein
MSVQTIITPNPNTQQNTPRFQQSKAHSSLQHPIVHLMIPPRAQTIHPLIPMFQTDSWNLHLLLPHWKQKTRQTLQQQWKGLQHFGIMPQVMLNTTLSLPHTVTAT